MAAQTVAEWLAEKEAEKKRLEEEAKLKAAQSPQPETEPPQEGYLAEQGRKFMAGVTKPRGLESQTPITRETPGLIASGLKKGIQKQFEKTPAQFAADALLSVPALVRTGFESFGSTLLTWAHDPVEAIPAALETAVGVGARFTPARSYALPLAAAARAGGEIIVGAIKGKNPATVENVAEVLGSPIRSILSGVFTSVAKGAVKEAVETGATEGLAAKAAKFLDLNKLSFPPDHALADTMVKPLATQVTPQQYETFGMIDAMNREKQFAQRERYLFLKPTDQMRKEAERIAASIEVLKQDPTKALETKKAIALSKQIREEVDKRGRQQQYMADMTQRFELEDHATLQGGVLPVHLLPVGPEQRAKALADPVYHKQLTEEVLKDLGEDTHPDFKPKIMEKKYGALNVALAKESWQKQHDLDLEMGRRIPAYEKNPKTGELKPINQTGDEVTDEVQRALTSLQRGEFDTTQTVEVPGGKRVFDPKTPKFWGDYGTELEPEVQALVGEAYARVAKTKGRTLSLASGYTIDTGGTHSSIDPRAEAYYNPDTNMMHITTAGLVGAKKYEGMGLGTQADYMENLLWHESVHLAQKHLGIMDSIAAGAPSPHHKVEASIGILEPTAYARQARQTGAAERAEILALDRESVETKLIKPLASQFYTTIGDAKLVQGMLASFRSGKLPPTWKDASGQAIGHETDMGSLITRFPHAKELNQDLLYRFEKQLETVPNEKLNALSAEMRRNREADRATRTTRRIDPNFADQELDAILTKHEIFVDQAKLDSKATGLAQQKAQVQGRITDLTQRDARTALLEHFKEQSTQRWEKANYTRENYKAENLLATPEALRGVLANKYMDLTDDMRELRQFANVVADDPIIDGQKAVVKELNGFGIAPALWDPQYPLNKHGDANLTYIGSMANKADYIAGNAIQAFSLRGAELFTKYGVDEKWNGFLQTARRHKTWTEEGMKRIQSGLTPTAKENIVRELFRDGVPTARGTLGPPATMPKFDERDVPMWAKVLDFHQDFMTNERAPRLAFAKELDMSPKQVAVYERSLLFPTSVAESELDTLTTSITRIKAGMEKMAAEGEPLDSAHMSRAKEMLDAATVRKLVAEKHIGDVGQALSETAALYDTHGIAGAHVFDPSTFEKHTDMIFGEDPWKSYLAHANQSIKKAVYDLALPAMDANLAKFMERHGVNDKTRGIERWVNTFLLDQVGTRKNLQYDKIVTAINRAGFPIKAETLKKAVGGVNTIRYVADIAMNLRFYAAQMTQNLLFLYPLVGEGAFTHGLGKTMMPSEWKGAAEEAVAVGAVAGDIPSFFLEDVPERMVKAVEKAGKLVEFTEKVNRVWAYHAGKKNGLENGLSEQEAIRHGISVVRDTNFFMTPSNRPTATNTPGGSMVMRYRSFSNMYANFLGSHIRKGNWDVVSNSVGVLLALSGTAGIPMYGMVQWSLAQQGINLPPVDPIEYYTGASLGGAGAALPGLPTSPNSMVGPVIAPIASLAFEGGSLKEASAIAAQKLIGGPATRIISGAAEMMDMGQTRTPTGHPKLNRSPGRVLASMGGFAPTAKGDQTTARMELMRLLQSGHREAIPKLVKETTARGVEPNWRDILSQQKSAKKRGDNQSWWGQFTGRE